MHTITAERRRTRYAAEPHLHFVVDGQPLDELLHRYYPDHQFQGLIPTLLSSLDNPVDREVVWSRATRRSAAPTMLPVLMCPDDLDLSCTVIIAQVLVQAEVVRWERLGWDTTTSPDPAESGRTVEWLPLIPPLVFARAGYQRCLDAFAAALGETA